MEHSNLSGLSQETLFCMSDGTHQLLDFIAQHIADLPNVDFTLLKHYYVKRRAEYYQKQGELHFVSRACEDIDRSRDFYYDNNLAGNL